MTDLNFSNPTIRSGADENLDDELQFAQQTLNESSGETSLTEPVFVFQGSNKVDSDDRTQYFVKNHGFSVVVPPAERRWEYQVYKEPAVSQILEEFDDDEVSYLVRFEDGSQEEVSKQTLHEITLRPIAAITVL